MKSVVAFIFLLLTGCTYVVTGSDRFVGFAHEKFVLKQDSALFFSECEGWSGKYMLAAKGQKSTCLGKVKKQYPAGTVIEVWNIIDEFGGEGGRCWRVQVSILDGDFNSPLADVPACWHWHPESWVTSSSPRAPVVLWFKPEFAKPYTPSKSNEQGPSAGSR